MDDLDDGNYAYELRVVPKIDDETRALLAVARRSGDEDAIHELQDAGRIPEFALVQSGSFTVRDGLVLTNVRPEQIVTKDTVFSDPVIVENGLCVGTGCASGEIFGSDVIRLKGTDLRVHFDDTSTGTSPSNDWRLIANDTTSGDYFALEDVTAGRQVLQVDAGAPSNAIRVDTDGDIGLGTGTPAADIHVVSGDTPSLRLEQDGSNALPLQTWELAGDEISFFLHDVSNGSKPLRLEDDSPDDAIFVAADGDVGLSTGSPQAALHVKRALGAAADLIQLENDGPTRVLFKNTNAGTEWRLNSDNTGHFRIADGVSEANVELTLTADGDLFLQGGLITGTAGTCTETVPCDGVFSDYELESIDEHAAYMWENEHLYGVGQTRPGDPIHVTRKLTGVLHELEKAHIYIEQLHARLREVEQQLKGRLAE